MMEEEKKRDSLDLERGFCYIFTNASAVLGILINVGHFERMKAIFRVVVRMDIWKICIRKLLQIYKDKKGNRLKCYGDDTFLYFYDYQLEKSEE